MTARYIVGDTLTVLATLEPASYDLVITSPPFLALRSYLPADHPDKHLEIGSEATPGEYLDVLLDVVEACARVLAPHGSLVFELGDTYAGGGGTVESREHRSERDGTGADGGVRVVPLKDGCGWPLDKSKTCIPQLFTIALAYGLNPLTGRQTEPWRVRNTVAWCRPNPPVGRDGDKYRPATSFLTIACKARDRYWDGDAVRTNLKPGSEKPRSYAEGSKTDAEHFQSRVHNTNGQMSNPAGAPLLDWWNIPTHPYPGAHYATWPPALVVPLIKAMCPLRVCVTCGEPARRIVAQSAEYASAMVDAAPGRSALRHDEDAGNNYWQPRPDTAQYETLGFTDCHHDTWRPGLILDPFAGSGTTLAVATGHGHNATGIDLDPRNLDLARQRIGMFLQEEEPTP
jgi:methylase of polypeptide subunit release factors